MRIGILGAGVIARHHALAAGKLPQPVELRFTDPNPAACSTFHAQFPQAIPCRDLDELLGGEPHPFEILINATPPRFHHDATIAALDSRRHVLCEKPLALDLRHAQDMFAAAQRNHRLLGCCSMRFADIPASRRVRELVQSGCLGSIYHVSFINRHQRARSGVEYQPASRWFLDPTQSGGGVLMDWGPYDIATLCEMLTPIRVEIRTAWMATPQTARDPFDPMLTEQHVGAAMVFHRADGLAIQISYERAACTHGQERSAVEIEGTDGAASWVWCNEKGNVTFSYDDGGQVHTEHEMHPNTSGLHAHDRPLHYFYRVVIGQSSPAIVNEQALFNFTLLQAIYDAARTGEAQIVERACLQTSLNST